MLDVELTVPRRDFDLHLALAVADGERFALFGPSGAGKTTFLESVAGLVHPTYGRIALDHTVLYRRPAPSRGPRQGWGSARGPRRGWGSGRGQSVSVAPFRRGVMLLRQTSDLFPHLDVARNLSYAAGRVDRTALDRICRAAGIDDLMGTYPRELSGGQARRVAVARALATDHRALLLDEPYDGLDAPLRRHLGRLVRTEVAASRVPAILVTHDLAEAQGFADRIGIIDRGTLLQVGLPDEIVRRPAGRRVAEMVGYRGFVPLAHTLAAVHPDRVRIGDFPGLGPVLSGRVRASRPVGIGVEVDAVVNGADITFAAADFAADFAAADPPLISGTEVTLTLIDPPLLPVDHAVDR